MKQVLSILLIGVMVFSMSACKKGENDPFISFRSRDARLTGTWKLTSASSSTSFTTTGISSSTTSTFNGTTWTTTGSGGTTETQSYSLTMTFDKGGSYTQVLVIDGDQTEVTGEWWWLDSGKNKTRIALEDDENSYHIDQLKNKEMILTRSSSGQNGFTQSSEGTWTYEKQ